MLQQPSPPFPWSKMVQHSDKTFAFLLYVETRCPNDVKIAPNQCRRYRCIMHQDILLVHPPNQSLFPWQELIELYSVLIVQIGEDELMNNVICGEPINIGRKHHRNHLQTLPSILPRFKFIFALQIYNPSTGLTVNPSHTAHRASTPRSFIAFRICGRVRIFNV